MSRARIQEGTGLLLILSGIVILILNIMSISEAKESWDAWAYPNSGTYLFIGAMVAEVIFLSSRFFLGYAHFKSKQLGPWVFYPLVVLVALSGLSGIVLGVACLSIRFWQRQSYAPNT